MTKRKRNKSNYPSMNKEESKNKFVDSLYDSLNEGNEYGSIVSIIPKPSVELFDEVVKGLRVIQSIRNRPCVCYVGNVVRNDSGDSGVDSTDDLPFIEMIKKVPNEFDKVDVFLATRGGSGHQIGRFV
jgi:hypothetical protein